MEQIETVIIGAGQAGLSTSYYLSKQARKHIVLEKASQTADQWRNQRWDSFSLVTPNWAMQLPGAAYTGDDPDGFLPRDGMVKYLDQYARQRALLIAFDTPVKKVEIKRDGYYFIQTERKNYVAENVVVAT